MYQRVLGETAYPMLIQGRQIQPAFSHTFQLPNLESAVKRPDLQTTRVFLIDRSAFVCDRLRALLTDVAIVVGQACDPAQAAAGVIRHRPDVVIVDMTVAEADEFRLLKQISRGGPSTVVIVLAEHMEDAFRQRCLQLGAHYFLDKTYEFENIRAIISNLHADSGADSRTASPTPIMGKKTP